MFSAHPLIFCFLLRGELLKHSICCHILPLLLPKSLLAPEFMCLCVCQGRGGSAGAGQGVGAVWGICASCGVLPEGERRLQRRPGGEVLDEGTANYTSGG